MSPLCLYILGYTKPCHVQSDTSHSNKGEAQDTEHADESEGHKKATDRARENAATRTSHNNPQWGHAIGDILRVMDEKRPSGYSGRTHPAGRIKTFESK